MYDLYTNYFPIACFVAAHTDNKPCFTKNGDMLANHSATDA